MMKTKRSFLFIVGLVMLLAATAAASGKKEWQTESKTCYQLYYNFDFENSDPSVDYTTWEFAYLALHDDGTFLTSQHSGGKWGEWGLSRYLAFDDWGCQAFYSGAKRHGYIMITCDGANGKETYFPGRWFMKKTDLDNCNWPEE